jgi:cell division septum initiation protein DivIVA
MTEKVYTQKEVLQNINTLQDELDVSKLKRTEITKRINELKKQIQYWKDLDLSQLKMF